MFCVCRWAYSKKEERANKVIYDDCKLKNPLVSMAYIKLFQRDKGLNLAKRHCLVRPGAVS